MNEREVAELRRRFKPERNSFGKIRGCYVNELGHIAARFEQSLAMMSQDETELLLGVLRKTLSGTLGKNLVNLSFDTGEVAYGEEHKLLRALRDSALEDQGAVDAFFQRVSDSVKVEGGYLILLVSDAYDVPRRSRGEEPEDSGEVYRYILCSVCPVAETKPALSYYMRENEFHNRQMNQLVSVPAFGFLYPAFDDRAANLYGALCYTKDPAQDHEDFVQAVFHAQPPMPAAAQKENFQAALGESLEGESSYEVVQAVHGQLREMIAVHKENHEREPLVLTKGQMAGVLRSCGVDADHAQAFEARFDDTFGAQAQVSPRNLIDTGKVEVRTPDVVIQVNPDRGDLVRTEILHGCKYILVRVEGDVQVNGVEITIA